MKAVRKRKKFGTYFFLVLCCGFFLLFSVLTVKEHVSKAEKPSVTDGDTVKVSAESDEEKAINSVYDVNSLTTDNKAVRKSIEKLIKSKENEYKKLSSDKEGNSGLQITGRECLTDDVFSLVLDISFDGNTHKEAYCFSLEDGRILKPTEVLGKKYREYLWDYFSTRLFEIDLDGAEFAPDFEEHIDGDARDFNIFLLDGKGGATFFFEPGQLTDSTEYVEVNVDAEALSGKLYSLNRIDSNAPMVALTFDDGPHEEYTARILDCLEKYDSTATFFDTGVNSAKYPELEKRAISLGCEIGSHTYNHDILAYMTEDKLAQDKEQCDRIFTESIGAPPKLLRPPEGNISIGACNFFEDEILVGWSIDTQDWLLRNPQSVMSVIKSYNNLDGQIILMHATYEESAQTVEELVPWLVEQGYQLVTVSELFRYGYHMEPQPHIYYSYTYFIQGRDPLDW